MEDIIAGRFETDDEARSAAASLADLVSEGDIFIFFNNQPGAHDSDRSPGDQRDAESGAKGGATGAASGAIAAGAAGTAVGGPAAGAVAAAVGGYTGSLAGAAGGLSEGEGKEAPRSRSAGMMLAVRIADADNKQVAQSGQRVTSAMVVVFEICPSHFLRPVSKAQPPSSRAIRISNHCR